MNKADFQIRTRFSDPNGIRNMTVTHKPTNISITSPDYSIDEKSEEKLKEELWKIMREAFKIWYIH